jgi:photosystem II stability/assembly factor-like uncharacterized protein
MNTGRKISILLFIASLIGVPTLVHSQWELLGNFGSQLRCVYFLDEAGSPDIGFVGSDKGLFRTTDRGKTWKITGPGAIDIFFTNSLHGWISSGSLYETTDGGLTWRNSPVGSTNVYYNKGRGLLLTENSISSDNGLTWLGNGSGFHRGFAFNNDSEGVQGTFDKIIRYTTDGGFSWTNSPLAVENWQPAGIKGTKIYFAGSENFIGTDLLYRSLDGGMNWKMIYPFAGKSGLTGTIRADKKHVYAQSNAGIYVSRDSGITWKFMCGPPNDWDTRFYISGDTVFAGDYKGNLWVSPTAGLGEPYSKKIILSDTALHFFTSACSLADTGFYLLDPNNCYSARLEIISANISGSKNFALIDTSFPRLLRYGTHFNIKYHPGISLYDSATLHLQFLKDSAIIDTTILLFGERTEAYGVSVFPNNIKKQITSPCQIIDTIIIVKNFPCDTVTINSATFMTPGVFTISSPTFPVTIPSDSSIAIHITGITNAKGTITDTLRLSMQYHTKKFGSEIPLTIGVAENIKPHLQIFPGGLGFGYSSVCKSATKRIYFINPICRQYEIISVKQLTGAPFFYTNSLTNHPSQLEAGATDSIDITFAPTSAGNYSGSLEILYSFQGKEYDTIVRLSGIGTAGTSANYLDTAVIFGLLSHCASMIKETYIQNTSCSEARMLQLSFDKGKYFSILEPKLPVTIAPGENVKIVLECASGLQNIASDNLNAILQSGGGGKIGISLPLSASILPDTQSLKLGAANIIFDTISVCSSNDTIVMIRNPFLCHSLSVDSIRTMGDSEISCIGTLKQLLLPGDSTFIHIHFAPNSAGVRQSTVHIWYRHESKVTDTTITITAISQGIPRMLEASLTTCDFGSRSLCEQPDTIVVFKNTGCLSVTISKGELVGEGFSIDDSQFPLIVFPDETVSIHIYAKVDTTMNRVVNAAFLNLIANTERIIPQIPISRHIIYPHTISIAPVNNTVTNSLYSFRLFSSTPDLTGINSLDFDLDYSHDLLEFRNAASVNTITMSNNHFQIVGNPTVSLSNDNSLCEIFFHVYLSPDTITTLRLSNLHLNISDPSFEACILSPQTDTTVYTYSLTCGEKTIYRHLRNLPYLESLYPNPAEDKMTMSLYSPSASVLNYEIKNIFGTTVLAGNTYLKVGVSNIPFDIHPFVSGVYEISIVAEGIHISKLFVKIK